MLLSSTALFFSTFFEASTKLMLYMLRGGWQMCLRELTDIERFLLD